MVTSSEAPPALNFMESFSRCGSSEPPPEDPSTDIFQGLDPLNRRCVGKTRTACLDTGRPSWRPVSLSCEARSWERIP